MPRTFAWFLVLLLIPLSPSMAQEKRLAEWTFMVFMNGDNNLEKFAINDFMEMAKVGSTETVNIVVQFDRIAAHGKDWDDQRYGNWSGTLRFKVGKGMTPIPTNAVEDIGEANMGDGAVLRQFVEWATSAYPAKRYALIIWNHGQGWRFDMATTIAATTEADRKKRAIFWQMKKDAVANIKDRALPVVELGLTIPSTVRFVSTDDSSRDRLYNREIQDVLRPILAGRPLDLIGYDACLMAMLETAYAMRELAHVMVASEELEPGPGWNYELLLTKLVGSPTMDGRELGQAIVKAFEEHYGAGGIRPDETTTLSAIDLEKIPRLAGAVSALAKKLGAYVKNNPGKLRDIRGPEEVAYGYKDDYFHEYSIDLDFFAEKLAGRSKDQDVASAAKAVRTAIGYAVIANFAGDHAKNVRGSRGVAIYFPPTQWYFQNVDQHHEGYLESNTTYPVEFVQHHYWDNFLISSYFVDAPGP